jgi:hypothetical protein
MNIINKYKMRIQALLLKSLVFASILTLSNCSNDETQTVASFTNLFMSH